MLPPTLFLICILAMATLHALWPGADVVPWPLRLGGLPAVLLGLGLSIQGSRLFEARDTEIKTFGQPRKLVTDGIFGWSRNPMYLGFLLGLLGVWLMLGSASPLLGPVVFWGACQGVYIPFEERRMVETFGESYVAYRGSTGRWLGRR